MNAVIVKVLSGGNTFKCVLESEHDTPSGHMYELGVEQLNKRPYVLGMRVDVDQGKIWYTH